jgi:hypothetical protein
VIYLRVVLVLQSSLDSSVVVKDLALYQSYCKGGCTKDNRLGAGDDVEGSSLIQNVEQTNMHSILFLLKVMSNCLVQGRRIHNGSLVARPLLARVPLLDFIFPRGVMQTEEREDDLFQLFWADISFRCCRGLLRDCDSVFLPPTSLTEPDVQGTTTL